VVTIILVVLLFKFLADALRDFLLRAEQEGR
jgi:ABC-type dipeptide/oligopeptide/nickel transport system permease subunit